MVHAALLGHPFYPPPPPICLYSCLSVAQARTSPSLQCSLTGPALAVSSFLWIGRTTVSSSLAGGLGSTLSPATSLMASLEHIYFSSVALLIYDVGIIIPRSWGF